MFPVFFSFKGGKAVATAFGCLLPIGVSLGLSVLFIWVITFKLSGYSSLAAILAVAISPLVTFLISPKYVFPVTMLAILVIARHSPNILRLLSGTEPKSKLRL
jgi:glycerol-3-phosphate acyltransferase PlsY